MPFTRPVVSRSHCDPILFFFLLMKPFSRGLLLLRLFSQIRSINVNNIFCRRYYVTIIFFSTHNRLCFGIQTHIPLSFTHEFILSTSPRELLLFTPRARYRCSSYIVFAYYYYYYIYILYSRDDIRFISAFYRLKYDLNVFP